MVTSLVLAYPDCPGKMSSDGRLFRPVVIVKALKGSEHEELAREHHIVPCSSLILKLS